MFADGQFKWNSNCCGITKDTVKSSLMTQKNWRKMKKILFQKLTNESSVNSMLMDLVLTLGEFA